MSLISQKLFISVVGLLILPGCLMTRSEVGDTDQSRVYGKKTAQNQIAAQQEAKVIDERDELIRSLNGRVEALENQLAMTQKEKNQMSSADQQKIQALQEALIKMEGQLAKLESDFAQKWAAVQVAAQNSNPPPTRVEDPTEKNSDKNSKSKNKVPKGESVYEVAQGFYANKDWKKAILNYQKYIDENPKGKEVADSKYKIGVSFQELGMKEEAMAFFEEVMAQFSKSEAAKKAKLRLSKIKK